LGENPETFNKPLTAKPFIPREERLILIIEFLAFEKEFSYGKFKI